MPDADPTASPLLVPTTPMVTQAQIEAFEDRLEEAVRAGDDPRLPIVGYGEVSVALKLPTSKGDFVCKRLVPFSSRYEALKSAEVIASYVEQLERKGIDVVSTETPILERGAGHIVYCVQPMLPQAALGPRFLPDRTHDPPGERGVRVCALHYQKGGACPLRGRCEVVRSHPNRPSRRSMGTPKSPSKAVSVPVATARRALRQDALRRPSLMKGAGSYLLTVARRTRIEGCALPGNRWWG